MPDRYWRGPLAFIALGACIVCIAAWLAWHFSALSTEERLSDQHRAETHIEYAQDRIENNCIALEGMALRDCFQQEIEAAKDHSRAEGDLDAQQAMARFNRVMAYTGIAGLFLAGASVVLILATLWETRSGIEIMRSEQRPWLKIDVGQEGFFVRSGRTYPQIRFESTIENVGKTAATAVQLDAQITVAKLDTEERSIGGWVSHRGSFDTVMFPNDTQPGPSSAFNFNTKICNGHCNRSTQTTLGETATPRFRKRKSQKRIPAKTIGPDGPVIFQWKIPK